ncbi:MAG: rhodanese-like domain-containing protein [Candidatus Krumholzibacteriia bacterium]
MKRSWTWLMLVMIALAALAGCSDDDNPLISAKSSFQVMSEAGTAYINDNTSCPGIISAAALQANLGSYTVIDIRAEDAYLAGHIPGAYHSTLAMLLADVTAQAIPTDKPFVIVCYSGQSAGHAKIALELLGYESFSLGWGMSSWSAATRGPWDNATINAAQADRNLLTNPETANNAGDLVVNDFPVLTEPSGSVVNARVAAMLAGGFKGITYQTVSANPDQFFILNYHGLNDYLGTGTAGVPGHIPGAFQFTPYQSLGWGQMLQNLPTDMPIVVYCWTGQHSSQITAYLNMLGYDAYSLSFGANKLFYDSLTASKWTTAAYNDFALEVGSSPTPAFAAVAAAGADYVNDSLQSPGVITAAALQPMLGSYTVIDIRAQADYDAGHIPGAVRSSLGTLLTDLADGTIPTGNPYVVVCYSGQSAGHANIAMELMGYETYTLKYGMSAWNSATRGPWDNATINATVAARNQLTNPETTNNNGDLGVHAFPELTGSAGTAVATAVTNMLTAGFKGISYETISASLDDYFVISYKGVADYEGTGTQGAPGHIPGAFQFTPYQSLGIDQMLAHLPTDKPIVVYCWTGTGSSPVAAYLNMLGYEAYSLTYGSNKLFYETLVTGKKWTVADHNDFPLEITPTS